MSYALIVLYFNTFHESQMQVKECDSSPTEKALTLIYRYMDYWIPICVVLTFPIWILPGLLYYLACHLLNTCNSIKLISKTLIGLKTPPSQLSYAIIRGNGRYLRDQGENVHNKQFYDYTSRRFMSIGDFEPETKIIELECESEVGLNFFKETISPETVFGVHSNRQALKASEGLYDAVSQTSYEITGQPVGYDCMLLFDFKNKVKRSSGQAQADLLRILAYCKYHMHPSGYLVFGDYFEEGEINTYTDLFKAFRLKVVDQQDITKNIDYAKKLKERKKICEQKMLEMINRGLRKLGEWRNNGTKQKFIVIIAEKE